MLEMPIPGAENPAAKAGKQKIPAKNLGTERLASKVNFGQRLKKIKQKTEQGGDGANNIEQEIESQPGKKSAVSIRAIAQDYTRPNSVSLLGKSIELDSSSSDPSLIKLLEANLGPEFAANVEQVRSSEVLVEAEETARRLIDYSAVFEQQDIDTQQTQSNPEVIPLAEQLMSPEVIQGSPALAEASQGLHKVEQIEALAMQLPADIQEAARPDEKSIAFKNLIDSPKRVPANSKSKSGEDKSKIVAQRNDIQAKNDQNEVKKFIDFEANRMKGSKLPFSTEVNNQEAGNDSQAIDDKMGLPDIKLGKMDVNFQNQLKIPPGPQEVIEQILDKIEIIQSKKLAELTLELKPDVLGKMTIKLAMEEGSLIARFITDNLHVKNILESNLNSLRQTLESQGIKVEKTEVNVQLNNGGMFDGSEGNQQDRWENQGYLSPTWQYFEEIPSEDEMPDESAESWFNYPDTEAIEEISMNFLI